MKTLKTKLVLIDQQPEVIMAAHQPVETASKDNSKSWVWLLVGLVVVIMIVYLMNKNSKS